LYGVASRSDFDSWLTAEGEGAALLPSPHGHSPPVVTAHPAPELCAVVAQRNPVNANDGVVIGDANAHAIRLCGTRWHHANRA
jgi:hypothetical protein